MTRETKSAYPINAKSPVSKEDSTFEQFDKTTSADSKASGASENAASAFIADKTSLLNGRERESHSQREAVIRPQQAGRIDFKALHSRPQFASDATWTNGKGSPLSPTGKSRGKDKNKRPGKGDRNQHQLYRLSISSSRSNPTIGIAYPQQKVTPPKKLEVRQGPISGSYHFNLCSLPDRGGEVHQEERNFTRSHPEPSASLTSTSYTSLTAPASRIHQGLKVQQGNLHETADSSGHLHFLEFQPNGNPCFPPDKHFTATSGYAISHQKVSSFPEVNKSDYGPVSFQYPFPSLQEQIGNTFCNNGSSQDFVDAALAASQVAHNTYSFQSSSRDGAEAPRGSGSYHTGLPDSRTYGIPSQQAPFLPPPTPPCYTGHSDHVADHNGAISSTGAFSSSGAIEQTQSTFQENQSVFNPSEFSLHSNSMPALTNKRPSKDFVHSQRLLTPESTPRRNIPQTSLSKGHFPSKVYSSGTGSLPLEKNLVRIPQTWDGESNNFQTLDQNSVSYPNASGNVIPYQCQPSEQRAVLKTQRLPWQQSPNAPSTNQNHIELSRHIGSQKPYPLRNPDWQNSNLMTKIPLSYHTKKHLVAEGSPTPRADLSRHNYSSKSKTLYDNTKDTSDTRTKSVSYGVSQPIQQSRNNSTQLLPLSGKPFPPESPYESPLPSPVTNRVSGSTCSSLSPMSSSPVNPDENQGPHTLTSSPYFHQPCHPAEKSFNMSDSIGSGSFLYSNSEPTKTYNYMPEPSKDEHAFRSLPEGQYQKTANEPRKGCLENFESEPPPPYSSHHFLASSLSSANLDQLDVLLTCKQCDQNFGNLSSFLEHRQYCHLNSSLQTELKDSVHAGDVRKPHDPFKSSQTLAGPKAQIEFNPHLPGFTKDYLLDNDAKTDTKEDPLKGTILPNATPHLMPLTVCDTLEMDDAKLDSLIIEALNGLEFQVDNPEIDSTFIDVFVDDDLPSASSQKVKENKETKKRLGVEQKRARHNSATHTFEEKYTTDGFQLQRSAVQSDQKHARMGSAAKPSAGTAATNRESSATHLEDCGWQHSQAKKKTAPNKTDFHYIDGRDTKSYESQQGRTVKDVTSDVTVTETSKSRRAGFKGAKKKKSHSGTWSKELIHKIVQQKNKLHKLHVKSEKNRPFPLVTERLLPATKAHPFEEYDYISDSDDERATSAPQNMPAGRMKHSFHRDIQGRGTRTKVKGAVWRMGGGARFQRQSKDSRNTNKETSSRIRRRNSQSSNSSDQSTSISSETGSSPKSTERTDSENEQECAPRRKHFSTASNAERSSIRPLAREDPPETDFTEGAKRFGSARFLLANSKVQQKINETQQATDSTEKNTSKTQATPGLKKGEQDRRSARATSALPQDSYTSKLMVNTGAPPRQQAFTETNPSYHEKRLGSLPISPAFCNDGVKYLNDEMCSGSKDFSVSMPCYNVASSAPLLPQDNKSYGGGCPQYPHGKDAHHLYRSQGGASADTEQIYAAQSHADATHGFANKCPQLAAYPAGNNESKISAALSFDSSSIFAELPISDFESPLYDEATASKENFVEFNQCGKTSNFEQQFPEFLQEKNWDLIDGISAPTENVPSFHVEVDQPTDKYGKQVAAPSEDVTPLSDYNVAFISNSSEDELEIKRLVTELESQLQTSKAHDAAEASPADDMSCRLTDAALTLAGMAASPVESCRNDAYFDEIPNHPKHAAPPLEESQPLVKVDRSCENLRNSWPCSVQFGSFTSDIQYCKQTAILSDARMPEGSGTTGNNAGPLADMSDECLSNPPGQIKCPPYPDHDLLKGTLVPGEERLSKNHDNQENDVKENQQNDAKKRTFEEQYDEPPELEPVRRASETDPELVLQDDGTPLLNPSETAGHKNRAPEKRLCDQQLPPAGSEAAAGARCKEPILHNKEGRQDNDNSKDFVLLDMPILVKEENTVSEKAFISKESSENPLQQLQLFVARTAKTNEEDMRIPCFPILLAASTACDPKTEAESRVESSATSIGESENSELVEHNGGLQLSECHPPQKEEDLAAANCCTFLEALSTDERCAHKQALSDDCSELNVFDGLRKDPGGLQPEARSPGQVAQRGRSYGESGGKKSSSLMKKEKPTSAAAAVDNEANTSRRITAKRIDAQRRSSETPEGGCLAAASSEHKKPPISKNTNDETQGPNSEDSSRTAENHQYMEVQQDPTLSSGTDNTEGRAVLGEEQCDDPTAADQPAAHTALPPNTREVLCSNNDYETHLLSLATAHSVLSFDLVPHASSKESTSTQEHFYTSADDSLSAVERGSLCANSEACHSGHESAKHSVGDTGIQLYLHKDKTLTSDKSRELAEENLLVVEGNGSGCFCSELVCGHSKAQQQPVTGLVLGCPSTPTNDPYPMYTAENTNYLTLQNDIFTESVETSVGPSVCEQEGETSKCDWDNRGGGSGKDGRSAAAVEFKAAEKTAVRFVPGLHNTDVENSISQTRCTNDMHSVIDGVLRILEGDKSKEILQSIGISPKSSPIKDKKSVGLSLTCDICSVSFRSKPGLTRHKAVKHNRSLASQKDGAINGKPLKVKSAACEWNCNNDRQHNPDTTSQNRITELLNSDSNLPSQILIPDEEQRPLPAQSSEDAVRDPVSKQKLDGKVKKRKQKPSTKAADSHIPSDEVLSILKTNILKAIGQSNGFSSSEADLEQSADKDMAHRDVCSKHESTESYPIAITMDDDEKLVSDVLDMEMNGENLLQEQTWAKNPNSPNDPIMEDCKIQAVETVAAKDEGIEGEPRATVQGRKQMETSSPSKETAADFHIFFDDDDTFSQLFPRDELFIRRKCTRVYGKRNKRQTPPSESDVKHRDLAEQCRTPQRKYSSDYGNISLQSTLDSSHFSNQNEQLAHYGDLSPSKDSGEGDESRGLPFVCHNRENMNVPSIIDRIDNEEDGDVSAHVTLYKPSAGSSDVSAERSPETRDSPTEGLPDVPTIDMKMLSTKFDMRELSFFSACGDDSDQSELETADFNQMPEKLKKNSKNKLNEKKLARNPNPTKMKSKDKQYKCKVCFQWFLTLGELDFHKLTHNPSPPPTCYMCVQRKFSSREQLRDHLKDKHAKNKAGLWICGMCLKEISDVWMYNEHLREHATQFARKGQAQKSVMGIPGCFGGDGMVRTFLSTFIYRTPSTPSKTSEADGNGLSNQHPDQKEHKGEEEAISQKEVENFTHVVPSAPTQQTKVSVGSSMDVSPKSDIVSKNAAIHPHCKDPSRDCHHCGKQFPKPFKLQRHLVVHSLQKIYLCPKCPKSYQEAQELRNHLNGEHQLTEKSEIKHTTLYACELCADVMHVIKKSFICSTCNYTFSKKEQYDRHMEKHLIGGSMTFKFRGVTRPTMSAKELGLKIKDSPAYDDMPPPKKLKTSTYSPTCADVATVDHTDLSQCPRLSPGVIYDEMIEENMGNENESTVKIEEIMMDAPELQAERRQEKTPCLTDQCPPSAREDSGITAASAATTGASPCRENEVYPEGNAAFSDTTDGHPTCQPVEPTSVPTSQTRANRDLAPPLSEGALGLPPSNGTAVDIQPALQKGGEEGKGTLIIDGKKTLPPRERSPATDRTTSVKSLKKNKSAGQQADSSAPESLCEESRRVCTPRVKPECSLARDSGTFSWKDTNASPVKTTRKDLTANLSKNNTDLKILDKMSGATSQKLHQRKRKEQRHWVHKGNTASQENLIEVRKKKSRLAVTGKSESSVNVKKSEWISSLLDPKDEVPGIRLHPKPHAGGIGGPFRKAVLDTHNQKKLNSQPVNGENKSKRTAGPKRKHRFSPKSSAPSSHKRKMGQSANPAEPPHYRTAESQNHLLSQLFGQKLTSFKIPLRRDVTE